MRILITGGSGLVGSALVNELKGEHQLLTPRSKEMDLLNETQVEEYIRNTNPELIIHLAAKVGGLYYNLSHNVEMFYDNSTMNRNLLKIAHKYNVQHLLCCLSTCIFPDGIDLPMTENSLHQGEPHKSNMGYAYAKRELDILCELYRNKGRNYGCIIPTNIYGPNDNFSLTQGHVIPMLIHKFSLAKERNEPVTIWGDGSALRQFIYSGDLARMIKFEISQIQTRAFAPRLILSVPEECEVSIRDISKYLSFLYKNVPIVFDITKSNGQHAKTVSNSLFMKRNPEFEFTELGIGLKRTVEWFEENKNNELCRKD